VTYREDGAVRNAFTLTALRYQVPIARIVELAPLLFVLAAEASLKRRADTTDARIDWLREQKQGYDAQWEASLAELFDAPGNGAQADKGKSQ
jgi:hypothetical protein